MVFWENVIQLEIMIFIQMGKSLYFCTPTHDSGGKINFCLFPILIGLSLCNLAVCPLLVRTHVLTNCLRKLSIRARKIHFWPRSVTQFQHLTMEFAKVSQFQLDLHVHTIQKEIISLKRAARNHIKCNETCCCC